MSEFQRPRILSEHELVLLRRMVLDRELDDVEHNADAGPVRGSQGAVRFGPFPEHELLRERLREAARSRKRE